MQCGGARLAGNRVMETTMVQVLHQLGGDGGFCLVCSGMQPVLGSEVFPDPWPQADPWDELCGSPQAL